jgi:transcription elongation factor Elf1
VTDESRFILCPHCNAKTRVKITQDTVLKNFPLFCPKCKRENVINVENYIITLIQTDAKTQC